MHSQGVTGSVYKPRNANPDSFQDWHYINLLLTYLL